MLLSSTTISSWVAKIMFNAEDNIPEELSMQVDDEAQNYIILSTPTLPSMVSVVSIPDEVIKFAKEDLGWVIKPKDDDACIHWSLEPAFAIVCKTLSYNPNLKAATEDEFIQNVKEKGKDEVICLFKDTVINGCWQELFEDSTSFLFLNLKHSDYALFLDIFQTQMVSKPLPPKEELSEAVASGV